MIEWTDNEGTQARLHDGRLSLYGKPSATRSDGAVMIGVDFQITDEMIERGAEALYRHIDRDLDSEVSETAYLNRLRGWAQVALRAALGAPDA